MLHTYCRFYLLLLYNILTDAAGEIAKPLQFAASSEEVKKMIEKLCEEFDNFKNAIRECLERQKVLIKKVADVLTSLSPDDNE